MTRRALLQRIQSFSPLWYSSLATKTKSPTSKSAGWPLLLVMWDLARESWIAPWTMWWTSSIQLWIRWRLLKASCVVSGKVTIFALDGTLYIDNGVERWCPRNIVTGAMLLRWGDGWLFKKLCGIGTSAGHSVWGILISESVDRNSRSISLSNRSIYPLLHEVYGSVKWWGTLRDLVSKRAVSFLKWVPPSNISPLGIVNVVHHSSKPSTAFSALALLNGMNQEYDEKSSFTISIYFIPVVLRPISIKSNRIKSFEDVLWTAGSNGRGSRTSGVLDKQWMQLRINLLTSSFTVVHVKYFFISLRVVLYPRCPDGPVCPIMQIHNCSSSAFLGTQIRVCLSRITSSKFMKTLGASFLNLDCNVFNFIQRWPSKVFSRWAS